MNVTFCAYDKPNYVGGPNAWLRRLLPDLRRLGVQSRVLFITTGAPPEECPTVSLLRQQGFDCPAVLWPRYTEDRVGWILKELAANPPDVFVPNLMVSAYYAGRWAREAEIPTVGVLHSDDAFHGGLLSEFVFGSKPFRLSALVCVSKFLEESVIGQQPHDTVVSRIPYGVPLSQGRAQPPNGKLRLMYVGRLVEEQKRIAEVTRALCQVAREISGTEAVIYGEGPEARRVKEIIATEGRGLPVEFAGRVDNTLMEGHLIQGHALALLSDYEGLPIALMEAMACGVVPICLQTRSGVGELVEHGVTGLSVRDREKDFIAAVQKLRQEPSLWKQLSSAARAKIASGYTTELAATKWKDLFIRLQQSSGPRATLAVSGDLSLPPVHPALAREDKRKPSAFVMLARRLLSRARNLKNRLATGGSPAGQASERLYPSLFSNRYYHLRLLRQRMEFVSGEYLPKKERSVLVDLGCGTMPYRPIFEKYVADYIGVDLMRNEAADSYADSNGQTSLADATADVVLSTQVLEHVQAPTSYLKECHRLLKPAGILILSTHGHWIYHPDPVDLWRWTGEGLKKTIIEAGFQVIDFHGLMGLAAMGSYFLQDGLARKIPRRLRPFFFLTMQAVTLMADTFHSSRERSLDASVFVVVARKIDA
jgi:colanic acid/amylovoran biosynthesis glycosyltransferase